MKRLLMLATCAFSLNMAACASQFDDPLPAAPEGDTVGLPHIDVAQGYPKEDVLDTVDAPAAAAGSVVSALGSDERAVMDEQPVGALRATTPKATDESPITWDELLGCITCAATRYKAKVPAAE